MAKTVNDRIRSYRRQRVAGEVAVRIASLVHANDTVGRLGGDEFLILLTDLEDVDECRLVLQRVV